MRVVVDTNILVKAFEEIDIPTLRMLLSHFSDENPDMMIVIDFKGIVRGEYQTEVGHTAAFQKWFTLLESNNQIEYQDGTIAIKVGAALRELGFHEPSDQTFVALALKTDKTIITEDSDYGKGKPEKAEQNLHILQFMQDELHLRVFDSAEAAHFLREVAAGKES